MTDHSPDHAERAALVRRLRAKAKRDASRHESTIEWQAAAMIEALSAALRGRDAVGEAVESENARLREKVDAFTNGDTFLVLRDEDQDKAACDLDDASLVKWVRWALSRVAKAYENKAGRDERSLMEVTTQSGVISLALLTLASNSTKATFDVAGVTYHGEEKGDWRVTIEQTRAALEERP